ncbi:pyrroline-5-carboxylate reductase [Sporosarcina pasteurii]|uniref:Pyrroline-5-carboxylate reductase n=1 Tax=Sporosarcina pasteurii TaxID=1474 RepID=A0A380BRE0_SPOPA|nr:pyrroline-5-carboxylate reductase [Sporosarcina pasteurii]MDS9471141.1 pyrroline-5-carboxylate reductase [Sporosarcina pasteurii]QBQ05219.1 pyrroline-5-carboxylate reductase [Sporosarcina pasteurii]SUJ05149.1 Pyrroline-5-carboxylate reductase [Sporosarcina pasteurii]
MQTIVFVGAGSMAEAIIAGMVKKAVIHPKKLFVMNKGDDKRLFSLQQKYGISIVCEQRDALKKADLVVLATKPQDIHQAMLDISPFLNRSSAVLSVIAGISIKTIAKGLGARPIARAMPNTSATIGKSATGIAFNHTVDAILETQLLTLMNAIGLVQQVDEPDLHTVTALSGSGPAYVYYLVEAFEEVAIQKGLSPDIARSLIIQTLEGATAMLKETREEPAILRENVTSPNGTTAAGLQALADGDFKKIIANCIEKASERSEELALATCKMKQS